MPNSLEPLQQSYPPLSYPTGPSTYISKPQQPSEQVSQAAAQLFSGVSMGQSDELFDAQASQMTGQEEEWGILPTNFLLGRPDI